MKNKFFPYFNSVSPEALDDLWKDCFFVFDTNILIKLYSISEKNKEQFFEIIESENIVNRLWLPYHIINEYFNNRPTIIEKSFVNANKDLDKVNKFITKYDEYDFNNGISTYENHMDMSELKTIINNMGNEYFGKLSKEINNIKDSYSKKNFKDPILEKIGNVFNDKIGENLDKEEYKKINEKGKYRFENKIPPGDGDENKDNGNKFGDLIIWKELIKFSKKKEKNVIFVCNDKKGWYVKMKHGHNVPRHELLAEFYEETGQYIYIIDFSTFLKYSKKYLNMDVDNEFIENAEYYKNDKYDEFYNDSIKLKYEKSNNQYILFEIYSELGEVLSLLELGDIDSINKSRSILASISRISPIKYKKLIDEVYFSLISNGDFENWYDFLELNIKKIKKIKCRLRNESLHLGAFG